MVSLDFLRGLVERCFHPSVRTLLRSLHLHLDLDLVLHRMVAMTLVSFALKIGNLVDLEKWLEDLNLETTRILVHVLFSETER